MTEKEALEGLYYLIGGKSNQYPPDYDMHIQIAIAALEKHIPKKPVEYEDKYYGCPTCDNVLMHKWKKYPDILMDKKNGLPYCLCCGQKLDWN